MFPELPAGVGFSYCDKEEDCMFDDDKTATQSLMFLQEWFKSYEEYRPKELYIIGESYAGIYIPTLAMKIMEYNNALGDDDKSQMINLKGIAIGNGCTGWDSRGSCGANRDAQSL